MSSNIVVLSDRIKELSHTKGQGPFVLDGELAGFSTFGDFYASGDVVYYAATDGTSYEVGSGEYRQNGSNNELTRFPTRSSALNSGPYYLNGDSSSGSTEGQQGYFYPLFLTKSAALAVDGATSVHGHTFSGYHGTTFYMPNNHLGHAKPGALSGVDYVASGQPFDFPDFGIKEVYVTYPGKYSVFTGYGISGFKEPRNSGLAVWGSEQLLNYDDNILWSTSGARLGISQTNPEYAIDIGGIRSYSQVRASGFIDGGSGVRFSGGQALPQDATKTASGGTQLEPFFRNALDGTTGTDAVFFLSGVVDERLCFLPQEKGTFFCGPPSGCEAVGCSPAVPTFRYLEPRDIPSLAGDYAAQDTSMDEDPASLTVGAVALYKESGVFTYDDQFVFIKASNRLGVGASDPIFALDVRAGNVGVSGDVITSGSIYTAYGGNIVCSGGISARAVSQFGGDVTISGNLYVKGTTAYIDSTNITVQDKQLELASVSGNDLTSGGIDSFVDDGGVVIRSSGTGAVDTGDKKWTWKNASNTWTAATSNNEKLGISTSGLIFNDSSVVSGAYVGGSGLSLHDGRVFQIGDMWKIGAKDSGAADATNAYKTGLVHQADEIGFSGIRGIDVAISGQTNGTYKVTVDPQSLSGVLQYGIDNAASDADLVNASGQHLLGIINASGAFVSGLLNTAISGVSGYTLDVSGYFNSKLATLDGGYGYWNHVVNAETTPISSHDTVSISGVSGIVIDGGSITRFSAAPLSGVLMHRIQVSGQANTDLVNASGAFVSGLLHSGVVAVWLHIRRFRIFRNSSRRGSWGLWQLESYNRLRSRRCYL